MRIAFAFRAGVAGTKIATFSQIKHKPVVVRVHVQEEISLYLITCPTHIGKVATVGSRTKSDEESYPLLLSEITFSGGELIWVKMF